MPSAKRDNLAFYFSIWMSFISFSSLNVLARTVSTMLNKNVESEHTFLIPVLRERLSGFPIQYNVSYSLSYSLYYGGVCFSYA